MPALHFSCMETQPKGLRDKHQACLIRAVYHALFMRDLVA